MYNIESDNDDDDAGGPHTTTKKRPMEADNAKAKKRQRIAEAEAMLTKLIPSDAPPKMKGMPRRAAPHLVALDHIFTDIGSTEEHARLNDAVEAETNTIIARMERNYALLFCVSIDLYKWLPPPTCPHDRPVRQFFIAFDQLTRNEADKWRLDFIDICYKAALTPMLEVINTDGTPCDGNALNVQCLHHGRREDLTPTRACAELVTSKYAETIGVPAEFTPEATITGLIRFTSPVMYKVNLRCFTEDLTRRIKTLIM